MFFKRLSCETYNVPSSPLRELTVNNLQLAIVQLFITTLSVIKVFNWFACGICSWSCAMAIWQPIWQLYLRCVCGGGGEVGLGELNWEDKSRGNWIIKNVQLKPSAILIVELSKQQKQNRNKLNSTHSMVNQVARSELKSCGAARPSGNSTVVCTGILIATKSKSPPNAATFDADRAHTCRWSSASALALASASASSGAANATGYPQSPLALVPSGSKCSYQVPKCLQVLWFAALVYFLFRSWILVFWFYFWFWFLGLQSSQIESKS